MMTVQSEPKNGPFSEEKEAVRQTVLNYIEAWYQGDPERGAKSLHPDLAKRIVRTHPDTEPDSLENMSAARLIERWGSGDGKATPPENQIKEVTVLDVQSRIASVKLEAAAWIDYMHLAKVNDQWVIVNVLWETKK